MRKAKVYLEGKSNLYNAAFIAGKIGVMVKRCDLLGFKLHGSLVGSFLNDSKHLLTRRVLSVVQLEKNNYIIIICKHLLGFFNETRYEAAQTSVYPNNRTVSVESLMGHLQSIATSFIML